METMESEKEKTAIYGAELHVDGKKREQQLNVCFTKMEDGDNTHRDIVISTYDGKEATCVSVSMRGALRIAQFLIEIAGDFCGR